MPSGDRYTAGGGLGAETSADPRVEYMRRMAQRKRALADCLKREKLVGIGRLFVVMAASGIGWFAIRPGTLSWTWLLPLGLVFCGLVWLHQRLKSQRPVLERSVQYYETALDRLDGRWTEACHRGDEFLDDEHPYADDLNIFGKDSLFSLLCTASTAGGQKVLADWLKAPASPEEVAGRNAAVRELVYRVSLREKLAGIDATNEKEEVPWEWVRKNMARSRYSHCLFTCMGATISFSSVCTLIGWGLDWFGPAPFAASVMFQIAFYLAVRGFVRRTLLNASRMIRVMEQASTVLVCVEEESFVCPWLAMLRAETVVEVEGVAPSVQIARFKRLISISESGRNQIFAPIAALLLSTTHVAFALERWRFVAGEAIERWWSVVGKFEAINALAGYAYEHPEDGFPKIVEKDGEVGRGGLLEAEEIGHPLLPNKKCVRNSIRLGRECQGLVVSGSNMSGKSTLLRTVGVNVVLAFAGAPVHAGSMRVSPLSLGASLTTRDSLGEGTSRFYAEVTRIRRFMDLAAGPLPLLYLLDEIFHGTNSHDRRIGADAVINGLLRHGAIGLVTTHDLALTQIAAEPGSRLSNVCFEDRFEDGRLVFDYLIRDGVVSRSSALQLMRSVGLEVG